MFVLSAILLGILLIDLLPQRSVALSSNNYRIEEDFTGGGGSVNSTSPSYQALDSIGAPGVGDSNGTAYRTQSGATTTNDPTLTFAVNTASVNLGSFSTSIAKTGTASFDVLNYTSYGYIVQTLGNPPNNGAYALNGISSPAASSPGTEQFGINLVANTSPTTFGADPQQVPNSTFSFGEAASGYNTANNYKYVAGNTIASAPKTSGQTTYTISYIVNVSNSTPGGSYSGRQTLVCIGTY